MKSSASVRVTAVLLFLGLSSCYLALSPGSIKGSGYVAEEIDAGLRTLEVFNAWVKGRPVPPMLWSRHGPIGTLFDLPFIKFGKVFSNPDRALSFQPPLMTAALMTLVFLWLRKLCSPATSLILTLAGAFGTMLWPYAYIGLETKQSLFVFLAGYLGLARGKIEGWPRLLVFASACGVALSSKSIGIILTPAIVYLLYVQFHEDWRRRYRALVGVGIVIAAVYTLGAIARNIYWAPEGGGATAIRGWLIPSPFQLFTNSVGLFGSPAKGLFVFAPILVLSIWAIPRSWRSHPQPAVFGALVTVCTVGFLSILVAPYDEVWGPRFMHILVAPLLLCVGAAWPRARWRTHAPMIVLALTGIVASFLGAFFYYGMKHFASEAAGQNTMEWLTGDNVWQEVIFDAALFRVWLKGGDEPIAWVPLHIWVWAAPKDAAAWKVINLRDYAKPQSFLLQWWSRGLNEADTALWRMYLALLVAGLFLLVTVVVRTAKEYREVSASGEVSMALP